MPLDSVMLQLFLIIWWLYGLLARACLVYLEYVIYLWQINMQGITKNNQAGFLKFQEFGLQLLQKKEFLKKQKKVWFRKQMISEDGILADPKKAIYFEN